MMRLKLAEWTLCLAFCRLHIHFAAELWLVGQLVGRSPGLVRNVWNLERDKVATEAVPNPELRVA